MNTSALDTIRAEIPEVAKALRLNLTAVLDSSTLAVSERWGVAIAVALASRSRRLAEALVASRPAEVSTKTVEAAVAASALMGMSNVFYRFRHLVGKPSYEQKPTRLRTKPGTASATFELFALAVSAVNGCETCVRSHEATLLQHGTTEDQIQEAVRIASVIHGAAVALDATSLIPEDSSPQSPSPKSGDSTMYKSPSHLSESARETLSSVLNARLADGLDLHSQIKVAHWNIKGPQFAALHPLFETFAVSLANFNDAIAERAVTLGGKALGTVRHVAKASRISEYPQDTTRDLEHVKLLAERFESYLTELRASRSAAESQADTDTVDLFTQVITQFEKNAWFLRASLEA